MNCRSMMMIALVGWAGACSSQEASAPPAPVEAPAPAPTPAPSAAPAAPTAAEMPIEHDFQAEVATQITPENYRTELDTLEAEINADSAQ